MEKERFIGQNLKESVKTWKRTIKIKVAKKGIVAQNKRCHDTVNIQNNQNGRKYRKVGKI